MEEVESSFEGGIEGRRYLTFVKRGCTSAEKSLEFIKQGALGKIIFFFKENKAMKKDSEKNEKDEEDEDEEKNETDKESSDGDDGDNDDGDDGKDEKNKNEKKANLKLSLRTLLRIALEVFCGDTTKENQMSCQDELKKVNGYNLLLDFLLSCKSSHEKYLVASILARFYHSLSLPPEAFIVIRVLGGVISSAASPAKRISIAVRGLISISQHNDNNPLLIAEDIVPALLPVLSHGDSYIALNACILLSNLCNVTLPLLKKVIGDGICFRFCIVLSPFVKSLPHFSSNPHVSASLGQIGFYTRICKVVKKIFTDQDFTGADAFIAANLLPVFSAMLMHYSLPLLLLRRTRRIRPTESDDVLLYDLVSLLNNFCYNGTRRLTAPNNPNAYRDMLVAAHTDEAIMKVFNTLYGWRLNRAGDGRVGAGVGPEVAAEEVEIQRTGKGSGGLGMVLTRNQRLAMKWCTSFMSMFFLNLRPSPASVYGPFLEHMMSVISTGEWTRDEDWDKMVDADAILAEYIRWKGKEKPRLC